MLAHRFGQRAHLLGGDGKSPGSNGGGRNHRVLAHYSGRAADGEILTGLHGAGGDHGHHRHERFGHHAAIADHARLRLAGDQLRRGAAGDQRMKSADGAASNGDKREREHAAGKNGPGAIDEAAQRRHMQCGTHRQNA